MTVGGVDPVSFGKRVGKEFSSDDIGGLAAELSYRYFLALFPFFIFLAALGGFIASALSVNDPTTSFMNTVGSALPDDARSVLETQVRGVLNSHNAGLLSFGIIGALWASAGAMKALIKALNRVYDVSETRSIWKSYLLAIGLVLAATFGILGSVVLYIATTAWGGAIAGWFNLGGQFELAIAIVRWPLIIALVMSAVAFIYRAAPNLDVKLKFLSPGAVLFTVVWIAATILFGFYVSNFGAYNKTYGTLGGVVVLLTWLYLTNVMLLLGAEVNAVLDNQKAPHTLEQKEPAASGQPAPAEWEPAMRPRASIPRDAIAAGPQPAPAIQPRSQGVARQETARDSADEPAGLLWAMLFGAAFALAAFGWRRARRE